MPDFRHTLQDTDLDFLLRVARFWGVDLLTGSFSEALNALAVALSNQSLPVRYCNLSLRMYAQ